MKAITVLLWICIILLAGLIAIRLIERQSLPSSMENIKAVLIDKTLPALKSTREDIFTEEPTVEQNSSLPNEVF